MERGLKKELTLLDVFCISGLFIQIFLFFYNSAI